MLSCDKGRLTIRGTGDVLLAELATLIHALRGDLLEAGFDDADEIIRKIVETGLMDDKELEKRTDDMADKLQEALDFLKEALEKRMEEGKNGRGKD